jgi:hypothetical protein
MKKNIDTDRDGSTQSRKQIIENLKLHNSLYESHKPGFKHDKNFNTRGLSWEEIDEIKDITDK